jgi:hypothetical protein
VANCFQQIQVGPLKEVQELEKSTQNMTEWGGLTLIETAHTLSPRRI